MPKIDSNIYGADDNGFASKIATDALSAKTGDADIWGSTLDQSAMSHGTSKGTVDETNKAVIISDKGDSRAKVLTNHGNQP